MNFRLIVFGVSLVLAPALWGADLSQYRDFRLGMPFADVAKQTGVAASEARVTVTRPGRIEELDWRTSRTSSEARPDSVREVLFSFYNGDLFEMMITYDQDETAGLTDADMIDALSGIYGIAGKATAPEMTFNSGYRNTVRVIAQWKDSKDSLTLVGFAHGSGFGVVVSALENDALARRATLESERLDRVEAPQREIADRAKQIADRQAADDKARLLNKPGFRP